MMRKILRYVQPVELGQTRGGFVVAAILIALWQLGGTALADPLNPGFSENQFFRLEWEYEISAGKGLWRITPDDDLDPDQNLLTAASFITKEIVFDSITLNGAPAPFGVTPLGDEIYRYSLTNDIVLDTVIELHVTYPQDNVGLCSTEFEYDGLLSAALPKTPFLPGAMNFVTIQQAPEPAAVSLLGIGAAAAAAFASGRRDQDSPR